MRLCTSTCVDQPLPNLLSGLPDGISCWRCANWVAGIRLRPCRRSTVYENLKQHGRITRSRISRQARAGLVSVPTVFTRRALQDAQKD